MKAIKIISAITIFFTSTLSFSQTAETDSLLVTTSRNYFSLVRENFHLQFNKKVYLTNESIWFKGYVFDKNTMLLYPETSNVTVALFDQEGQKLNSKLLYASNGIFEGNFKLNSNFKSGDYYLHVYTNYTNNFVEDESSLYKIEIINTDTGKISLKSEEIQVEFYPEGGSFVESTDNTIGIQITDCLKNGIAVEDVLLLDSNNKELGTFSTNDLGYGKFQIYNAENKNYKIKFTHKNKSVEKKLPDVVTTGFAITINNYGNESNAFINIKCNPKTLEKYKEKELYLAINQASQINYLKFKLEKTIQNLTLPQTMFYDGINTIRIIDDANNQLNERMIYRKFDSDFAVNYTVTSKTKDSVKIEATFLQNVNVGISVVTAENKCFSERQNIHNSVLLAPYLNQPFFGDKNFFSDFDRKKMYELDLFLVCQSKSKYEWSNMKNPPVEKYTFNKGVTLKGTLNAPVNNKFNKMEMYSIGLGINEKTTINDKNEFKFVNFIAVDSTALNFTLRNSTDQKLDFNFYTQITTDEKQFTKKPAILISQNCSNLQPETTIVPTVGDFPSLKNANLLKEVLIKKAQVAKESENSSQYGNANMRRYKIDDSQAKMYSNILQFLNSNGFSAGSQMGSVYITNRLRTSITRVSTPTVFLNGVQIYDFEMLDNFRMDDIDEIFIDKYSSSIQSNGGGVIKIYTRKEYNLKPYKLKSKTFIVKNGFDNTPDFNNPTYEDTSNDGFKNYGTINWSSVNQQKHVVINIPTYNQKSVMIVTEGISEDGKLIYSKQLINIE